MGFVGILGWGDFPEKHASYCGNLGMTHKDENDKNSVLQCTCARTPLFLA